MLEHSAAWWLKYSCLTRFLHPSCAFSSEIVRYCEYIMEKIQTSEQVPALSELKIENKEVLSDLKPPQPPQSF